MLTKKEMHDEFWLLTKSILEDSRIDADEAHVIKRWLEEHQTDGEFSFLIEKIDKFLADGYMDRWESTQVMDALGHTLRKML